MVKMTDTAPLAPSQFSHQDSEMASQYVATSESSSSDFSVVSHPPESNIIVNGSLSGFHDLHFGLNNAAMDLSFEEMQGSIQRLLLENAELKEIVQQDHTTMKSQYELMLNSKEQIEMFIKQQLERREQAKALIEKLQAEIAELKEQKGDRDETVAYKKKIENLMDEIQALKQNLDVKIGENEEQAILYHQIQMEFEELRSDCNQLRTGHAHLVTEKRELAAINAELQAKLNALQSADEFYDASNGQGDGVGNQGFLVVQPNSGSGKPLEQKDEKMATQTIKSLLDQLAAEQSKSQALIAELEAEKAKLSTSSQIVHGQEEAIRRLVASKQDVSVQQGAQLMAELQASEQKVCVANNYIQKYRERCDSLEMHLNEYENRLESLQTKDGNTIDQLSEEVQSLRKMLETEKQQSAEDKKHLLEAQEKSQVLMQEFRMLQQNWGSFSQEQESKGRQSEAYYCLQMKTLQERVDSLTAKLVNREEALMAKEEELTALKAELQKLKADAETIPILQAQVEVYKGDFHAEREARERAQEEKDRVLEELMQARASPNGSNRKHRSSTSSRRAHSASGVVSAAPPVEETWPVNNRPSTTVGTAAKEQPQYNCPKCNVQIQDYHILLTHVNECLDKEDPFAFP